MAKTLEEKKAHRREYMREYMREYYAKNPEKVKESVRKHRNTLRGRASHLLRAYNQMDRERDLPQGDLTIEQVEELIQQPCAHCRSSRMGDYTD